MANTRQATKRARQSLKKNIRNKIVKSAVNTYIRNTVSAIKSGSAEAVKSTYYTAVSKVAQAAGRGFIPKSRAGRHISRLTRLARPVLKPVTASQNK